MNFTFDVNFCNSCSRKMTKVAFYVSKGSVAIQLMCGRTYDKGIIANFLLNPMAKQF